MENEDRTASSNDAQYKQDNIKTQGNLTTAFLMLLPAQRCTIPYRCSYQLPKNRKDDTVIVPVGIVLPTSALFVEIEICR